MLTSPTGRDPIDATRQPLRLTIYDDATDSVHGAWWPRSRDLSTEAADLVDNFPASAGRIDRVLFSRPDWDDAVTDGQSLRRIQASRGPVKVGSFPQDDTHLVVLTMASRERLRLTVVPSATTEVDGARRMRSPSEPGGAEPGS